MKELIKQALSDAFELLNKQTPLTKTEVVGENIDGISPMDIPKFMVENNIPIDAWFGTGENEGFVAYNTVMLYYNVTVPTTEKEQLKYKRYSFTTVAWKSVYNLLLNNGYKRVGYNTSFLKEFDDTSVYDMYINNEFDRLVKYYSLPFVKID